MKVGVAISATELLIQKGKRSERGTVDLSAVTATGEAVITTGFRPSNIRIFASGSDTAYISTMSAVWNNGTLSGNYTFHDEAASGIWGAEPRLYDQNSTVYMTFSITSVTDTGFTITYTETSVYSQASGFIWEAEGEL